MDREPVAHRFDGPRLWVSRAVAVVFVLGGLFVVRDLGTSVHEHRVLRAGVTCGASTVDCLEEEAVTLGPRNDVRRTRMVDWYARGVGEEPGDSDLIHLLPEGDRAVLGFGPSAVAHRVDGAIVAVSRTPTSERVPVAWDGTHGALVDSFLLAGLVGLLARNHGMLRECRRAGLSWSDRLPLRVARQRRPADWLMLAGGTGFLVAFVLATYDALAWTLAGLFVAAVWWAPAINRRIRAARGVGRHAA